MSRLHSMIRRLEAQIACLDWACAEIAGTPGVVLELGLGNGRTYDHLREKLPASRPIHVFDRYLGAHPDCVPPQAFLTLGEIRETLPAFATRGLGLAAMVHADLGSGDPVKTRAMADWLGPVLPPLLTPGGLVLSDQSLAAPGLVEIKPPVGELAWRYFVYKRQ
ncbi:MAG: hypothetical protein FJX57_08555 [Alphaproteobacteria bacterium]|nr:hypothetical protein [Alphaproteobacteria bacterium]